MDAIKNTGCGLAFMGVWLGFWALCTLGFDIFLGYSAARQCWAYTYASTQGTVTSTKIETNSDSDGGTTYTPEVHYTYTVNGQQIQADRISYLFVSSSYKAAEQVVNRFPTGRPVTVYYNPASPGDSVLVRSIDGMALFMGMFLLPFNVIMLGVWYGFFSHIGPGKPIRRWLHFASRDDGLKARLTIYTTPPLLACGMGAAAAAFVMTFVVGFGMSVLPVFWLAALGWIVVLAAAILAWRAAFRWASTLAVDRLSGKLEFQQSGVPHTLAGTDVREIVVDSSSTKDSEGNVKNRYATCLVCPQTGIGGTEERIELCDWSAEDLAEWVRDWVSEKLRKTS